LGHTKEAVRVRRRLARQDPDAYLPALAMSLNNLANRLRGLGYSREAASCGKEAAKIHRQLAEPAIPEARTPMATTVLAPRRGELFELVVFLTSILSGSSVFAGAFMMMFFDDLPPPDAHPSADAIVLALEAAIGVDGGRSRDVRVLGATR